jgi:hypothetical protein
MYEGKLVFAQLMDHLPMHTFRRCVARFKGDHSVKSFTCQDQLRCMAFAQLTFRESLRDTVTCLQAQSAKLYHMGLRGNVARSTLAEANEGRDWRLYATFAQALIAQARKLYAGEPFGAELDGTAYALDTTNIELCLSLFPGPSSSGPRGPCGCTRSSTSEATSRPSSTSTTANPSTAISWTRSCRSLARST